MSAFEYFMKTKRSWVVLCMRYAQPAVTLVKVYMYSQSTASA